MSSEDPKPAQAGSVTANPDEAMSSRLTPFPTCDAEAPLMPEMPEMPEQRPFPVHA
ncbi:MAG: hypothetical protein RLZZ244_2247, partial [Verrucomicrobiota bacterium]